MIDDRHVALLEDAEVHQAHLTAILIRLKQLVEMVETEVHRSRGIAAVVREDGEPR